MESTSIYVKFLSMLYDSCPCSVAKIQVIGNFIHFNYSFDALQECVSLNTKIMIEIRI